MNEDESSAGSIVLSEHDLNFNSNHNRNNVSKNQTKDKYFGDKALKNGGKKPNIINYGN